jgi:hypothetical protein
MRPPIAALTRYLTHVRVTREDLLKSKHHQLMQRRRQRLGSAGAVPPAGGGSSALAAAAPAKNAWSNGGAESKPSTGGMYSRARTAEAGLSRADRLSAQVCVCVLYENVVYASPGLPGRQRLFYNVVMPWHHMQCESRHP